MALLCLNCTFILQFWFNMLTLKCHCVQILLLYQQELNTVMYKPHRDIHQGWPFEYGLSVSDLTVIMNQVFWGLCFHFKERDSYPTLLSEPLRKRIETFAPTVSTYFVFVFIHYCMCALNTTNRKLSFKNRIQEKRKSIIG